MEYNFVNPARNQGVFGESQENIISNGIKIINATYKVLDFFPENEPLKNKAKEKALSILDNLTLISMTEGWASLQKEKASCELLNDIEILETYFKLAKCQGWINGVNFLIFTKEYNQIKNSINISTNVIVRNLDLMSISSKEAQRLNDKKTKDKDKNFEIKDSENKNLSNHLDQKNVSQPLNTREDGKISARQEKVLEIITKKTKAQVSDIIKEIPDITKRTIRRDLEDLLKRGEIVRFGDFNQIFYQIYPVK